MSPKRAGCCLCRWECERLQAALGEQLKAGRLRYGLSAQQLAAELGVHMRTVQRWEAGSLGFYGTAFLPYLCKRFGIDIRRLA